MVVAVICLLTAVLTIGLALIGACIGFIMKLAGQDAFPILFIGAATVCIVVQKYFRMRTRGRASLVLWYSFEQSASLAGGSALSFIAGYLFVIGWMLTSGIAGAAGLIVVAYICVEGPCYGWDECIPRRKRLNHSPRAGGPFEGY